MQSIALQRPNECVASSLQRFGDCYLIYRLNEPLLDTLVHTHTHTNTVSRAAQAATSCCSRAYESYADDKTTCRPPYIGVRCSGEEPARRNDLWEDEGIDESATDLSPSRRRPPLAPPPPLTAALMCLHAAGPHLSHCVEQFMERCCCSSSLKRTSIHLHVLVLRGVFFFVFCFFKKIDPYIA